IPCIGLCMGYFEIFYAWVKVHYQSVAGNFLKEIFLRALITIFLFLVYFEIISVIQFVYYTVGIYFFVAVLMAAMAFSIERPSFCCELPKNAKLVLSYSIFIILSGSVAVLLLDIDK